MAANHDKPKPGETPPRQGLDEPAMALDLPAGALSAENQAYFDALRTAEKAARAAH